VTIGPLASVFPMCVLRGRHQHDRRRRSSNIQDGTIVHWPTTTGVDRALRDRGHAAMITPADRGRVPDRHARDNPRRRGHRPQQHRRGRGAGHQGHQRSTGSLVLACRQVDKTLSEAEQADILHWAEKYVGFSAEHKRRGTLSGKVTGHDRNPTGRRWADASADMNADPPYAF
jgi:hypothetical protein